MNGLLKIKKGSPILGLIPLKMFVYAVLISDLVPLEEDDEKLAVFSRDEQTLYDLFPSFDEGDEHDFADALNTLTEENLIYIREEDELIVCGTFQGKTFVPFTTENSMFDRSVEAVRKALKEFGTSLGGYSKSRRRHLADSFEELLNKGVASFTGGDFNSLHEILYEVYTGGENYVIKNKVDGFQTTNMIKHYDKNTVFSIIVEAILNYDKYRSRYTPSLTMVANMAEDVYRALIKSKTPGSKDYLREKTTDEEVF